MKDITNASAEVNRSIDAEMEGTFVVDKVTNNNDDTIEDSENKKKPVCILIFEFIFGKKNTLDYQKAFIIIQEFNNIL